VTRYEYDAFGRLVSTGEHAPRVLRRATAINLGTHACLNSSMGINGSIGANVLDVDWYRVKLTGPCLLNQFSTLGTASVGLRTGHALATPH
jgi:hypothetical protein